MAEISRGGGGGGLDHVLHFTTLVILDASLPVQKINKIIELTCEQACSHSVNKCLALPGRGASGGGTRGRRAGTRAGGRGPGAG